MASRSSGVPPTAVYFEKLFWMAAMAASLTCCGVEKSQAVRGGAARRGPRGAGPPDPRRRVRADRDARARRRLPGHVLRRYLRAGAPRGRGRRTRERSAPHAPSSHGDRRAAGERGPRALHGRDAVAVGPGDRAPPASGVELRGGGRGGSRPRARAGRHPGAVRGLRARRGVDRRLRRRRSEGPPAGDPGARRRETRHSDRSLG